MNYGQSLYRTGAWLSTLAVLSMMLVVWPARAAAGKLYLKADKLNYAVGETMALAIRLDTGGDQINTVQANLTYPADRLEYIDASSEGSAFPIQAEEVGGGGKVMIARGSIPKISGDQLVSLVRFKVKSATTKAVVNFATDSAMYRSSDNANILTSSTGLTLQLTAQGDAAADTTAPQINGVQVEKGANRQVTVKWTTNEPASSLVEFGIDQFNLSVQSAQLVTAHSLSLPAELLQPNVIYKLRVVSVDSSNNVATSQAINFEAPGLTLTLRMVGADGRPLSNAVVTIGNQSQLTDKNGNVAFDNLSAGEKQALVKVGDKLTEVPVQIESVARAKGQEQMVQVAGVSARASNWWGVLLLGFMAAAGALAVLRRKALI